MNNLEICISEVIYLFDELDKVVNNKKDKKILIKAMINYPVVSETLIDMVTHGLEPYQVYEICTRWYIEGIGIKQGWLTLKNVLPVIK